MKILVVHNSYGAYSGEERAVEKISELFSSLGHNVVQFKRTTEGLCHTFRGKVKVFMSSVRCREGEKALESILKEERPDMVNVHNLYPFITPRALAACRKRGIPVVMTVHNYRIICPNGLFMRNRRPCERCLEYGTELPCVLHNCEHSIMKSLAYSIRGNIARRNSYFLRYVDRFVCLTEFQASKLKEAGVPEESIVVIPNYVDLIQGIIVESQQPSYAAYCGRLSVEKGIDLIYEAASRTGVPFKIAGENPKEELENRKGVEKCGFLKGYDLERFYNNASFAVIPSRCYEGLPMSLLEAMAHGLPVVVPDHGPFPSIVGNGEAACGLIFKSGDQESLADSVRMLWSNHEMRIRMGQNARDRVAKEYSYSSVSGKWDRLINSLYN